MSEVLLPSLGYATTEGTILRWEKMPGDPVEAGQPLFEIAAEKAIHVVPAPETGILLAVYAPAGAVVPEGGILAWIGKKGETAPENRCQLLGWAEEIAPLPLEFVEQIQALQPPPAITVGAPEKPGKKERAFVKAHLRDVTAQRMAHSWVEAPKVDLFAEVDFTHIVAHREGQKAAGEPASPYNIYIVQAVVKAFEEFPALNCHWRDGARRPLEGIHVGVAVALEESLLTISLKNLAGETLQTIERQYRGLIRKAVSGTLRQDDLFGSSLTVTNLGEFEIFGFTPILNPPELFILAIGELKERAVVRNGQIMSAPISYFCLSFDHRGVDGAPASRLLQRIKHHLEHFEAL